MQASWATYDEVVGGAERQRWYTLAGTVASGQARVALTIYQNTGGNFAAPPSTIARPVGTGELAYKPHGPRVDDTLDPLDAEGDLLGLVPAIRKYGPLVRRRDFGPGFRNGGRPDFQVIFFAWMTYAPNGADAGPAGQRWYTGLGAYKGNLDSIHVQLYESTDGLFDQGVPVPTTVLVGNANMNFLNNCYAELSFNFTDGSSAGASGRSDLRLAGTPSDGAGRWDY